MQKIYSIHWILVEVLKKNGHAIPAWNICLRVNISNNENIENNGILQSFDNYMNNSFCFL